MASNTRIPKAELTGIYGAMVKRMSRRMLGDVAEPVEVAWHNRKVLNFSFGLGRKAQKWDACDENLKSFAHMAVASLVGCSWCLDLGYFQAHNEGLDVTKAREVPRWRESDVFTPLERDVMEYAEAMSQTPPTVTDELSARLLDQLGAAALVELTAFIALANLYTRSNVALGIESQGFAAACELTAARRTVDGMTDDPFVTHRSLLFTVAYEMLGSAADAEDVVQETWLRWAGRRPRRGAATRGPTWSGSSPGRRSTGCGRWRGGARSTSGSGCPSRCSPVPTWPRTSSSPRASRSRC